MKRFFNLIEVTLSIAVIGIGMLGIMSLFPIGIDANRQSVADNYVADAAEQFLTYMMRNCNDTTAVNGSKDFYDYCVYWDNNTPTNLADDVQGLFVDTSTFWAYTWNSTDPANDAAVKTAEATLTVYMPDTSSIFQSTAPATYPGLFKIKQSSTIVTDFDGIIRVWKAPITGVYIYEQNLDITYPYAARLYVEVSWPSGRPYSKRDKRTFCTEIFRQKL